jgi:pimeloyl-ACP methyl ester carboxylesterase
MPRLGLSMVEGTVVEWHARPGDAVTRDAVLLTVESEKAEVEVEAFASGVLAAVYVEPGITVPVGTLLGAIAAPDEAFDAAAFAAGFVPETAATPAPSSTPTASPARPATPAGGEVKAAPAARALARRLDVDLEGVTGTGPGGRITVEDVERAAGGGLDETGLSFARAGAGPALLFVNGYGVDASSWRRQVDGLAPEFTIVTYDHPGVGRSRPIGDTLTIARLAADAQALLSRLGVGPVLVVGASMGAAVALELALADPGAVRALVLVTPVLEHDARFETVLRSWREHEAPGADSRIRAMLPWLFGRELLAHAGRREAAAAALRAMAARTPPAALRQHADALLAWLGTRGADLGRIGAPALVVAGGDDVLTPRAHAEAVVSALPRARLEVLEGAGHALMIERAEALNQMICELAAS